MEQPTIFEQDDALQMLLQEQGVAGKGKKKRRGFLDQTGDALDQNQLQQVAQESPMDSMDAAGAMDSAQGTDVLSNSLDLPQAPQGNAPAENMLAANTRQPASLGQRFDLGGGSSKPRRCEIEGNCPTPTSTATVGGAGDGRMSTEQKDNQIQELLDQKEKFVTSPEGMINPEQYQETFDRATAMLEMASTTQSAVDAGQLIAAGREMLSTVYNMRDQDRADLAATLATTAFNQSHPGGRTEIMMDIKTQIASGQGEYAAMDVADFVELSRTYSIQNLRDAAGEGGAVDLSPEAQGQMDLNAKREYAAAKNISALLSHEVVRRGIRTMENQGLEESQVKNLNDGLRAALVTNITSTISGTLRDTDGDGAIDETFDGVYNNLIEPGLTKGFASTLTARQQQGEPFPIRIPLFDKTTGEHLTETDENGEEIPSYSDITIDENTSPQFIAGIARVKSAAILDSLKSEVRRQVENREQYSPPDPKTKPEIVQQSNPVDSNQGLEEPPTT